MAELSEQRLGDVSRAFAAWGRALGEDPKSEQATEELERIARLTQAWQELVQVYEQVLAAHPEPESQRPLNLRLARVYDEELHDRALAEETYLKVLAIEAKDETALAALDRIYAETGMWTELADILRRRIALTTVTDDLVELYFRLGRVYSDALDDGDAAIKCYDTILDSDSRSARALEALERIYFKREDWARLFTVYEKMVDIAPGDEALADCYAHMARLQQDALGDEEKATDLWGRVIDLRGEDPIALEAQGDLHERRQEWRELVDVLERTVRITQDPHSRIALHKRLGPIWSERLNRERNALEAWEKVLEIDPSDLEALRAISELHKRTQAWPEYGQALRNLIDAGVTRMHDDEVRELYAELGRLESDDLMRPQESIDAWRHVVQLDPGDSRALAALEKIFTSEARWEECIEILERKAALADDPAERLQVLLQAGAMWEEKVGDAQQASAVYDRVLAADPSNQTASVASERIAREGGNWEKVIEILLGRVEFLPELQQRIEVLHAVARTYEQELQQPELAFEVLRAAFKEDYTNDQTAMELQRLASTSGTWNDLLGDYSQVVQTIKDPVIACDLWVKIANWYGEHLNHLQYAVASAQQALSLDPKHTGALAALSQFHRKAQRWPDLAATLTKHADVEPDPKRRVELLLSLGELQETQLNDVTAAIGSYVQALAVDAGCLDALVALDRNYRRQEMWEQLVDVLSKKARLVEDADEIIRLHLSVGDLYEHELNNPKAAIGSYKEVTQIDPRHLAALRSLEQLFDKVGDVAAHAENLEQQLDAVDTDDERVSLLRRLAAVYEEQFQRADKACEAFEKILQLREREEGAYRGLERLYAQERKFDALVDTLRRHINAITDVGQRIELYGRMGQVYEEEIHDSDRAIEAFQDILSFDADHTGALHALGRLYEKIENWPQAIETMEREIQLTDDKPRRTELYHRIGAILYERMNEPEAAEERFVQALTIDPAYVPSMNAVTELYKKRGDWLKAGNMMVRAEAHAQTSIDKVKLLYEAGRIFLERIQDDTRAADLFARTIALDPEHQNAGEPLAEIYFREEKWAELEPILDMLVRKADKRDGRELNVLYYRLAKTADELGNADKALKYYKAAYDIDSTYLPTLLGRASLLYKQEDWDGSFKIYQTILVHHRESQKDADIVEIFYRLGNIKLKLGERKKAQNMFEKALEIDANHRPTLGAMIELQGQAGDWEAVIHAKRSLANTGNVDEKFKILDEIGNIYQEQLKNPQKAVAAYLEALEIHSDDHQVLHKVLDLYTDTKQWKKTVEILVRLVELTPDPITRGKYYYAAAAVYRDEVKAVDEAIEYFEKALDCYFEKPELVNEQTLTTYLKPFEAIDRVLTQKKDWENQQRAYRRMIKRLPPDGLVQIKVGLYHALGEIYRSRLRKYGSAIAAFEVASQMEPNNNGRHEILAELYVAEGSADSVTKAVAEHQLLIKGSPYKIDSYRALRKIYMDARQYDKAWCLCAALAFLKKADPEEQQFFEQYRPKGMPRARARLTDDLWNRGVFHSDQDRYIGSIFATIQAGVAVDRSKPHKDFGLKRKDKHDLATSQVLFPKIFGYALQVLGVPQPELYLRPEQPGELAIAPTNEKGMFIASVVAGGNVLQGRPERDLAFISGRWLAMLRPEHFLKWIISTNAELKLIFLIALRLVNPKVPVPGDPALVQQLHQQIVKAVPPSLLEALAAVVTKFLATKAEVDLSRWSSIVDLTCHRVGFILSGDLETSARLVSQEPVTVGGMQPKERITQLILYSISEEYFMVRQALGLAVA
jgi:tetratricopeptide (TPR) repeat protein